MSACYETKHQPEAYLTEVVLNPAGVMDVRPFVGEGQKGTPKRGREEKRQKMS